MTLLIHPQTKNLVDMAIAKPPHALLLVGPSGAGKQFLAEYIVKQLVGQDNLENYPYWTVLDGKVDGSIDAIRGIKEFLSRKTVGKKTLRRFVIIDSADSLGHEAQNAMLKFLEEPPADTMIILTARDETTLLPTIISRTYKLPIAPLDISQIKEQAGISKPEKTILASYHLSGGQAGLFTSLVNDDTHPLREMATEAKNMLRETAFQRLARVDTLAKQKNSLEQLLFVMERVLNTVFINSAGDGQAKRLHRSRKSLLAAKLALQQNSNTKLTLTRLFLEL